MFIFHVCFTLTVFFLIFISFWYLEKFMFDCIDYFARLQLLKFPYNSILLFILPFDFSNSNKIY